MQTNQLSAKIYQFAPRSRSIAAANQISDRAAAMRPHAAPAVDWECGWYHDAAIAEDAAERATAAEAAVKVRPLFPH